MISCSEAIRQLWAYLEGAVEGVDRERMEEHLSFCRKCCGEIEFIEELKRFLKESSVPIPHEVHARLVGTLDALEESS